MSTTKNIGSEAYASTIVMTHALMQRLQSHSSVCPGIGCHNTCRAVARRVCALRSSQKPILCLLPFSKETVSVRNQLPTPTTCSTTCLFRLDCQTAVFAPLDLASAMWFGLQQLSSSAQTECLGCGFSEPGHVSRVRTGTDRRSTGRLVPPVRHFRSRARSCRVIRWK
jgi:hypothetical protein